MTEPLSVLLAQLERQYLAADELLLLLASVAPQEIYFSTAWHLNRAQMRAYQHTAAHADSFVRRWVNPSTSEAGKDAHRVVAMAVAGADLRDELPELADVLGHPWSVAAKTPASPTCTGKR